MKLILTREVNKVGNAGDVVTVKDGYARNFLLPRGVAIVWSLGGEKQIEGKNVQAAKSFLEERHGPGLGEREAESDDIVEHKETLTGPSRRRRNQRRRRTSWIKSDTKL